MKIRTAKRDAMAEGRPYKRERRRKRKPYGLSDPFACDRAQPSTTEQTTGHNQLRTATGAATAAVGGPGLDAWDEAMELARQGGGFAIDLRAMFRERARHNLVDV